MKYRKLRIAFSVTCGIACVLLVVLWVRSHYISDSFYGDIPGTNIVCFGFQFGEMHVICHPNLIGHSGHVATPFTSEALANTYRNNPIVQPPNRFSFGFSYPESYTVFTVPHWLLAFLAALLTALPWIRWRFSLRTLLIGMTLVAVVLGLIVYASGS